MNFLYSVVKIFHKFPCKAILRKNDFFGIPQISLTFLLMLYSQSTTSEPGQKYMWPKARHGKASGFLGWGIQGWTFEMQNDEVCSISASYCFLSGLRGSLYVQSTVISVPRPAWIDLVKMLNSCSYSVPGKISWVVGFVNAVKRVHSSCLHYLVGTIPWLF